MTSQRLSVTFLSCSLLLAACGGTQCPAAGAPTTVASSAETLPLRDPTTAAESLTVTIGGLESGRFQDAQVFSGFGCTGGNRSPELTWAGAPEGTKSFAIVLHDPDAPTGVGFFHWVVLDLPATTTHLDEGQALPEGVVQGHTDFGAPGYGGPCPPPGNPHRYEFTVYALDVPSVGLPATSTAALVRFAIRSHTLAIGRASATWGR